jgi:GAF domain-containing protein
VTLIDKIQHLKGDESRLVEHLVDRLLMGQSQYGVWLSNNEQRRLWAETRDEHLDAVAYLCMDAIQRADEQDKRAQYQRHDAAYAQVRSAIRASFVIDEAGCNEVVP